MVKFSCSAGDLDLIPGLGRSLEEGMGTHSSILAWRIPWTKWPSGLQSMGSQRVGHNRVTKHSFMYKSCWKSFEDTDHAFKSCCIVCTA